MSNPPTSRELKILAIGFELAKARVKELEAYVKNLEEEIVELKAEHDNLIVRLVGEIFNE